MVYDGASLVLLAPASRRSAATRGRRRCELCAQARTVLAHFGGRAAESEASASAVPDTRWLAVRDAPLDGAGAQTLVSLAHVGFWTHSTLGLIFSNLLPHSKHFHIITSLPNAFTADITPPGRLQPMAASSEKLMEMVGAAAEKTDPLEDAGGRRTNRALYVEGDPRLLHLHRVRTLLGQLPCAPDRQGPQPQAFHARFARSPLRARGRVPVSARAARRAPKDDGHAHARRARGMGTRTGMRTDTLRTATGTSTSTRTGTGTGTGTARATITGTTSPCMPTIRIRCRR